MDRRQGKIDGDVTEARFVKFGETVPERVHEDPEIVKFLDVIMRGVDSPMPLIAPPARSKHAVRMHSRSIRAALRPAAGPA